MTWPSRRAIGRPARALLYAQSFCRGAKNAGHSAPESVGPANVKRTVTLPLRKPNAAYRSREHLTEREVERLVEAAKDNRWGHRDSTMVLLAFRHGLRAAELVDLRLSIRQR
jgi:integrase